MVVLWKVRQCFERRKGERNTKRNTITAKRSIPHELYLRLYSSKGKGEMYNARTFPLL